MGKVIWTLEKCKEEALKYTKRVDFRNNSSGAYDACVRNKWFRITQIDFKIIV